MAKFVITTSHDAGTAHITTHASDVTAAIKAVKNAERCPDISIKSAYLVQDNGFLQHATGENAGMLLRITPCPADVVPTPCGRNPYATGYGERIPAPYMVKGPNGRLRRVYVRQFSNVGTAWVKHPTGYRAILEIAGV